MIFMVMTMMTVMMIINMVVAICGSDKRCC